jgi:hypothetical protein
MRATPYGLRFTVHYWTLRGVTRKNMGENFAKELEKPPVLDGTFVLR